jgi:hypothetical protein
MADWDNKQQPDSTEEEFIELTDIISTEPNSDEEEPIELMEVAEKGDFAINDVEKDDKESEPDFMETDSEKDEEEAETLFDYKDKYLEMNSDPVEDEEKKTEFANISREELEAALERVIEKQYADKIQDLLLETVEKVIEKEISKLKENLQKDFKRMGGIK